MTPSSNVNKHITATNVDPGPSPNQLLDFSEEYVALPGCKKIDTEIFEVCIPASMTGGAAAGIDTSVWEFKDNNLEFDVEYGALGGDQTKLLYAATKNEVKINNEPATVAFADMNNRDPHAAVNAAADAAGTTSTPTAKGKILAAFFRNKDANFSVRAAGEKDLSVGKKILSSIKFK